MAELDLLTIAIPVILSGIISFILLGVRQFSKTSEGTLSGTIKLEHVTAGIEQLEERIDKKFEKLDQSINNIWKELNDLNSGHKLNTYRLDKLERNGRNGRSAV